MTEAGCRTIVRERSGGLCELAIPGVCQGRATNMHHRRKEARVWVASNVLDACGSGSSGCHGHVEANPSWAREEGFWLFTGDGEPAEVSCHIRWTSQRSWWLLDDDGMLTWDGGAFEPVGAPAAAPLHVSRPGQAGRYRDVGADTARSRC